MMYDIYVVGTGATGSNVIANLAQYAISEKNLKSIILIDGDKVESKNFRNQRFIQKEIGLNKAVALSRRYSKLGININYYDEYITNKDMLCDIICKNTYATSEEDEEPKTPIIISCVDNNNARIVLDKVFRDERMKNLIYIDAGNGDESERVGQVVIGAKCEGNIIAPPVADYFPQILNGDKEKEISYSCSHNIVEKPQCLSTNLLSATTVFLEVINIISYNKSTGKYFAFDAESISIKKVR